LTHRKLVQAAASLVHRLQAVVLAERAKLHELETLDVGAAERLAGKEVEVTRVRVGEAELALDECGLRAPVAGTVLRVQVRLGDLLGGQPRPPAILFCPDGPRIIRAEVAQEFAGRVRVGQAVTIHDDITGRGQWRGRVVRIADWFTHRRSMVLEPKQHNDVRTLECVIVLAKNQPPLRIGQRMRVKISYSLAPGG
jgi:multidrug resistance efflux pump